MNTISSRSNPLITNPNDSRRSMNPQSTLISTLSTRQQPGVGLFFHENNGKFVVKTIVSGGSAERDGRVQVGDVLIAVDGVDVRGLQNAFKNAIIGPEGTTVRLKMLRGEGHNAFGYELDLVRGTPEYFAGQELEKRHEEELMELKLQLKQALAEEQQVAEEVDRIKRLLAVERVEKERRDKDLEMMEASFDEDKNQLLEALRKVDLIKRDIEQKLSPVQAREQELTEELARQTDKDRLRKEYIEELQKRHEERKYQLESQLQIIRKQRAEEQVARMELQAQLVKAQAELRGCQELEARKAQHDATFKQRQAEEERELFKELLENAESLSGYVHEMRSRMDTLRRDFFDAMPQAPPGPATSPPGMNMQSAPPNASSFQDQYFLA